MRDLLLEEFGAFMSGSWLVDEGPRWDNGGFYLIDSSSCGEVGV